MNRFPYTNFHDINLDWIVKQIKDFASSLNALAQRLATFVSLPAGGSTGEALVKRSNANYDVEWDTIQAGVTSVDGKTGAVTVLPVAGGTGQALVKRSAANYDVEWDTISGGSSVYYAEYGVTSVSDIYAEYSADKIVLCEYSGNIYSLFNCSPTLAHFSYINENVSRVLEVVGSVWTYSTKTLAIESNVHDIPQGGTAGQALTKIDSTDYNVQWQTISGSGAVDSVDGKTGNVTVLPTGGTAGQALTKIDGTNYNVQWQTISGSGAVDSVDGKTGAVTVLPVGGTADQVLAKVDGTNYNVYWKTISGGGSTDIYWCTYGTTTYSDISTALANGMLPVCSRSSTYYVYSRQGSTIHYFTTYFKTGNLNYAYYAQVDNTNTWSNSSGAVMSQPLTATTGQFLQYNGSTWVAADLPLYTGGVNP